MKHLTFTQSLAAVALTLGVFAAASSAHARSDVYFSIGLQVPGVMVQTVPVQVQPRPYYEPAPVYYRGYSGAGHNDRMQYQRRNPYGDRDGMVNIHDWGNQRNHWRQTRLHGPFGDLDRDGIANRWDRDRDGDGVRNRYDRNPNNPNRR